MPRTNLTYEAILEILVVNDLYSYGQPFKLDMLYSQLDTHKYLSRLHSQTASDRTALVQDC